MLTINNTFSRRKRFTSDFTSCVPIFDVPASPSHTSPRPILDVLKFLPNRKSPHTRPNVPVPVLYTAAWLADHVPQLETPDCYAVQIDHGIRFQSFFSLKIHQSPVSQLASVCKTMHVHVVSQLCRSFLPWHWGIHEHGVQRRCLCRLNIKTRRKPLKNGLFWSRYSFVTHSTDRKLRDWVLARSAYSSLSVFLLDTSCRGRPSGDVPCAS